MAAASSWAAARTGPWACYPRGSLVREEWWSFRWTTPLAPEHPFLAAIEDCFSVLQWVSRRGDGYPALAKVDLSKVIVAGGGSAR